MSMYKDDFSMLDSSLVHVRPLDFEFPSSFNQSDARIWLKLQNQTQATNQKPAFCAKIQNQLVEHVLKSY